MRRLLLILCCLGHYFSYAQELSSKIKVDQFGYYPEKTKIAIAPSDERLSFELIDAASAHQVYAGVSSKPAKWNYSGETVVQIDFSAYKIPGNYVLKVSDTAIEASYEFSIGEDIYNELLETSMQSFYLARSSMEIEEKYAGKFARPLGHPDTEVLIHTSAASQARPAGTKIASPGGWYDAGDYNKYVVNSGITTFTLLHIFEIYPELAAVQGLHIPEMENGIPDLLDEILHNLRWMMSMQDKNDGGVYHKLTHLRFSGIVPPHEATEDRYVMMKTTAAALNLAAVCAKAARVLGGYEELADLRERCVFAAMNAYRWAQNNPDVFYKQPEEVNTGKYGDRHLDDEFFWAATELYLTTTNTYYIRDAKEAYMFDVPSWNSTHALPYFSLIAKQGSEQIDEMLDRYKDRLIRLANDLLARYTSAYKVPISVFNWGSNGRLANEGLSLIMTYKLTGDEEFLKAAQSVLHYLHGRNPLAISFITGCGEYHAQRPHERRSMSDGIEEVIPGYLVGGPNADASYDCGKTRYEGKYPAIKYLDENCSFLTNEVAINWSAAYVALLSAVVFENQLSKNKDKNE